MSELSDSPVQKLAYGLLAMLSLAPVDPLGALTMMRDDTESGEINFRISRKQRRPSKESVTSNLQVFAKHLGPDGQLLQELRHRATTAFKARSLTIAQQWKLVGPVVLLGTAGKKNELPRAIFTKRQPKALQKRRRESILAFRRALLCGGLMTLCEEKLDERFSQLPRFGLLTVEELAKLLGMKHRTLQRMASSKLLPNCYRRKRERGHWKIVLGESAYRWLVAVKTAQLSIKLEKQFSDTWVTRRRTLHDILEASRCFDESADSSAEDRLSLFWRILKQQSPDSDRVKVLRAIEALELEGVEPTIERVSRVVEMSPATFKRRGFAATLKERKLTTGETAVLEKDRRAKRQDKKHVLQETEDED